MYNWNGYTKAKPCFRHLPRLKFFLFVFVNTLCLTSHMEEVWSNLTDENTDKWLHAIDRADRYHLRMLVFRSGMIEPELRNLQLAAHKFYDLMSPQELRVFKKRTLGHTFVDIAAEMEITESSVKEYWRRTLKKIGDVIEKTNNDEEKES